VRTIGYTGTRDGMTSDQLRAFRLRLVELGPFDLFLHGACKGADSQAARLVYEELLGVLVNALPGHLPNWVCPLALEASNAVQEPRKTTERNWEIVERSDAVIACPKGTEDADYRSGTWMTIRAAKKLRRPVTVILPDGSVHHYPGTLQGAQP
jgi:hypothetical protein